MDNADIDPVGPTARRLVSVYDGGAIPTTADKVYLTHPAEIDSSDVEGSVYGVTVDTATTIPVIVLWNPAIAGDLLTAYAVGGRWFSEKSAPGSSFVNCGSCTIPARNLRISWLNVIIGPGNTTLFYNGALGVWTSNCTNGLIYQVSCIGGTPALRVFFFIAGVCPTGVSQFCSTAAGGVGPLTRTSLTCGAAFNLTATVGAGCANLVANGYTAFNVTT